jgi:hypothetical protein
MHRKWDKIQIFGEAVISKLSLMVKLIAGEIQETLGNIKIRNFVLNFGI